MHVVIYACFLFFRVNQENLERKDRYVHLTKCILSLNIGDFFSHNLVQKGKLSYMLASLRIK